MLGVCATFVAMVMVTMAQSNINPPIPLEEMEPGIRLNASSRGAPVQLEAFVETLCPDSAAAWPILQQVAAHYGTANLDLIIQQFPLPYHRWGYTTTMGYYLIYDQLPEQIFAYLEMLFSYQSKYGSTATQDMSYNEVVNMLAIDASLATGIDATFFQTNIASYGGDAINAWKYACRRGSAGTPWFFVNGVDIAVNPSVRLTFEDWTTFLDPLFGI